MVQFISLDGCIGSGIALFKYRKDAASCSKLGTLGFTGVYLVLDRVALAMVRGGVERGRRNCVAYIVVVVAICSGHPNIGIRALIYPLLPSEMRLWW